QQDAVRAQPCTGSAVQGHMQGGAVNADLGDRVSREAASLLLVQELAEAVVKPAFLVLDALGDELFVEADLGELAHRMREQGDADAELLQLRRGLVDAAGEPPLVQVEGQGEPGDAGADDRDFHNSRYNGRNSQNPEEDVAWPRRSAARPSSTWRSSGS